MIVLEIIFQFIFEVIFIEVIGNFISRINNVILKFRGIETKTPADIKLNRLRNRYEHKTVQILGKNKQLPKGSKGVVLELIDQERAFVELNENQQVIELELKNLLIRIK